MLLPLRSLRSLRLKHLHVSARSTRLKLFRVFHSVPLFAKSGTGECLERENGWHRQPEFRHGLNSLEKIKDFSIIFA
jgi:hypothetical protein